MAAALPTDIVPEIEDLLTCCMCLETLNEPKSLPCSHTFCKVCLGKYVDGLRGSNNIEIFPCPTCRSEFTLKSNQNVGDLPCIYFIKNMLQLMAIERQAKGSRCSFCEGTAITRCMTCEMFMCEKCNMSHAMFPVMKNHDVFCLEELGNPECQKKMRSKLHCKKHADKILEYYCETCKELSCIHCMVLNHTKLNHSCVSVDEIGQKQREKLQESCATLDEKLSEGKEALNAIDELMESLKKNAKIAKDQIHEQKEKIIKNCVERLEEQAKKMVDDVNKIYGGLHGELSKQHDEIKDYVVKVEGSMALPRNLLKRGSVEDILSSQKGIEENVEKVKTERPENLAAVNDGRIHFISDNICNINYGAILNNFGFLASASDFRETGDLLTSTILKEEIAFIIQLRQWLGDKCKWNLCYRASRDGWNGINFHRNCDNKGPTVVLIKANKCIFGGYTDKNWGGPLGYTFSNSSFLFSLRNKDNLAPFISNIKQANKNSAIYCAPSYGPWFGSNDILIKGKDKQRKSSYCNFGQAYQLPPGYLGSTEEAKNLLAGEFEFFPSEIEVFC